MKHAIGPLQNRLAQLSKNGFLLMLDFDGVLAPIVERPDDARMSPHTRHLLSLCSKRGQVAVISGRSLRDVRSRVTVPGVWYAGNHGAQLAMGTYRGEQKLLPREIQALRRVRADLESIAHVYPGVKVENKKFTLSLHYRALEKGKHAGLAQSVRRVMNQYNDVLNFSRGHEYVFDVRPITGRTKGDAVTYATKQVGRKVIRIYIGDDAIDEYAFMALKKGFSIRVGRMRRSAARFFIKDRDEVDKILELLAHATRTH